jgi:hypothetical protein
VSYGDTSRPVLDRMQQRALVVGAAALVACAIGGWRAPEQFFRSWLVGFLFWAGVALGGFAMLMLHHMVGGGWGFVIRRLLEAATRTFPVLALLFLPVVFGVYRLYEWSQADVVAADAALSEKGAYLNLPFFYARAVFYFATWLLVAWVLNRWSAEQDRTGGAGITRRLQLLSGPGLLLYGLTATFASVDWVMSLEPHWFSTVYGLMFIVGQGLSALAFVILLVMTLGKSQPLAGVLRPQHYHDLGNLTFAFTLLWAYIGFSQFLIVWSGNLPEENVWYLHRFQGGWEVVAIFLLAFHFAVPFLLLLSRRTKRNIQVLAGVAVWILLMRYFDLYWLVKPAFENARTLEPHWLDLAAAAGIGGVWLWEFVRQVKNRPLLPVGDARMAEAFEHATQH